MTVWRTIHASTAELLSAQVRGDDVAHAWLLMGPAGSGKVAAALAMAAALDCETEPGVGCGTCSACLRIMRRRHPDVHHVVAEGAFIHVDTVRTQILVEAARSPFEARYKVFVIEEAERMNPAAQNALLKTLEEPETDTIFILLTAREEELLDTIKSRCRSVRLQRASEQDVIDLLVGEGVPHEVAFLAARVSEGDLQHARALATDHAVRERRDVWLRVPRRLTSSKDALDVAAEIGAVAKEAAKALEAEQKAEVVELAEALGEGRGSSAARTALAKRHKRELRRAEEDVLAEALATLASFYRDVLALRRGGEEGVANVDLVAELRSWADAHVPDASLVRAIERCIQARSALAKNANQTLTLEATALDLFALVPGEARIGAGATGI